jgi:hypothetical protein
MKRLLLCVLWPAFLRRRTALSDGLADTVLAMDAALL